MAGQNVAVFGIYRDRHGVDRAVDVLRRAGFRNTDVSVLFPENEGTKDFAIEKGTKAPEGTAAGASTGAVVGGALGWIVGIGALAIPGIGPFIAAGPIVAALAGVGAGGVVGGLLGALVGLGMPEYEAKRYEGQIRRGGILMSVHCDGHVWVNHAKHIMKETGAEDIASAGEASADFAKSDRPLPRHAVRRGDETAEELRRDPTYPVVVDRTLDDETVELEPDEVVTKRVARPL